MNKKEVRKEYLRKRKLLTEKEVEEKSRIIQKNFLDSEFYKKTKTICIYMDYKKEVKTDFILSKALADGKNVYIPKIKDDEMFFTLVEKQRDFIVNKFGIMENKNEKNILENSDNCLVVVPLVAYSEDRRRIGYGGGFYDKWMSNNSNNIYVGLAYDFQLTDFSGFEEHDLKLDCIITEKRVL